MVSGVPSHGQQAGPQRGASGTWEGALQLARRVRCGWGLGNLGGFFNHVGGQILGQDVTRSGGVFVLGSVHEWTPPSAV